MKIRCRRLCPKGFEYKKNTCNNNEYGRDFRLKRSFGFFTKIVRRPWGPLMFSVYRIHKTCILFNRKKIRVALKKSHFLDVWVKIWCAFPTRFLIIKSKICFYRPQIVREEKKQRQCVIVNVPFWPDLMVLKNTENNIWLPVSGGGWGYSK